MKREKGEKKKQISVKKAVWLGIVLPCVLLLGLGTFGLWTAVEGRYTFMQEAAEAGDFQAAERAASVMPDFYRDTATLRKYIQAGRFFENGDYERADAGFSELGDDYLDAKERRIESKFARGDQKLKEKEFEKAEEIFRELMTEGAAGAEEKIGEVYYNQAKYLLEIYDMSSGDCDPEMVSYLEDAYDCAMKAEINGHPEGAALETELEERFYTEGIKYFEEALQWDGEDMALWDAAGSCFVHVPEERENASDYFMLTCIIVENSDDEKIVEKLMERMDFEPVRRTMACSRFLPLYLEGDWESGTHVFTYDWEEGLATSLDIGNAQTCYFQNGICYGEIGSREFRMYEFRPISADTMEIHSFLEEKSYKMNKLKR